MAGSSNFLQWNNGKVNQESDATYLADAQRTGGAPTNSTFASPLGNKLFYQLSTWVTAMAAMLAAKGYAVSDASLSTLSATLAAIITSADSPVQVVAGYGPQSAFSSTSLSTIYANGGVSRLYRVSLQCQVHSPSGTSTVNFGVGWTQNGVETVANVLTVTGVAGVNSGYAVGQATFLAACDASTNLQYQATWAPGISGPTDNYVYWIGVEEIPVVNT